MADPVQGLLADHDFTKLDAPGRELALGGVLMLAQGIPLRSIQEVLGHSSITLTADLYAHVGEQLKREAADAMDAVLAAR